MRSTRLETIWYNEQPNTIWLRDDGLIGWGEAYDVPHAISAIIHAVFANLLLGRSPFDIEPARDNLFSTCSLHPCVLHLPRQGSQPDH